MKLTCYDYYYINSNNDNDNNNTSKQFISISEWRCLRRSISSSTCADKGVGEAAVASAIFVFDSIFY